MKDNVAVFLKHEDRYVMMHVKDDRASHIYVYENLEGSPAGCVINCRVDKNAGDSSFLSYAPGKFGYLDKAIKPATVLPLQYKKDSIGGKQCTFSGKLSIDGDYIIVTHDDPFVKVSSKVPEEAKKSIIDSFFPLSEKDGTGILIRTKAYTDENGIDNAHKEYDAIKSIFDSIEEKAGHLPQYSILYRPLPLFIKDILYLCDLGITEIVTDDMLIKKALEVSHDGITGPVNITDRVSLRFYEDSLIKLYNLYSFGAKISETLNRKVYLKCGAYITIDETEALTAIDVNSSSCKMSENREESFLKINIEAAQEIARQLVLRNIAGMIIIDFINMKKKDNYDILSERLRSLFKQDRLSCRFIDFTPLGLAEVVRRRSGVPLAKSLGR